MKKILTSVVLFAAGLFAASAQQTQLTTGDTFTYTNADGVEKTYKIVGENLITNPSFDNGTEGWTGGDGKALGSAKVETSGGIDDGFYIIPTTNVGKGGNASIAQVWDIEKGKTYVFSYFIKQNTNTTAQPKEMYIVTSETDTPRGDETKTLMFGYEDADCAWTQNLVVTTAEYKHLQFCARWLDSRLGFDAFILAEVEELASSVELEQLIAECDEWINTFGDEAKGLDVFDPIVQEAQNLVEGQEYTAEALNAMVHKLSEALLDFRMANASDEYTVDVTNRYLKNSDFENGLAFWTRNNDAVDGGSNIRGFEYFGTLSRVLEINEGKTAVSKDTHVSQTVYDLPLGYYRFTVQCVMNHAVDKTTDPEAKSGAAIYCNGDELDMVTEQITTDGAAKENSYPQTFTIEGIVSADSIIVGFVGYQTNNFTYVAIDNVRLEYAGFDAGIYIDGLVNEALEWINDNSDFLLPGIAYNLEEEAYAASGVIGEDEAIMNAAYIHLDSVFTAAKQSVELVEQLNKDYEEFVNFVEETQYRGYDDAVAFIEELAAFLEMKDENAGYAELNAMIAKLEQAIYDYRMGQDASKDTPADYTFLIPNANFEEKGNWVWTIDAEGKDGWVGPTHGNSSIRPSMDGGEARNGVNLWGNKIISIDLHQELTGLPNGLYGISAELITQTGYATDQHLYVTGVNTSVSPNLEVDGWDAYQWTTLQTGYVVVIDGTLTIGAASSQGGEASEGWFQATNFKLQYYGEASPEDLQVAYEATLAEAQALIPTLLKGDAAVLQAKIDEAIALSATNYGEAAALLVEPVTVAKTAALAYNTYKTGAYQTAVDNNEGFGNAEAQDVLGAAIAFADAITNADTTTTAALPAIEEKLNAYSDYATYLEEVGYMVTDRSYAASNVNDVKATIAAQKADLTAKFQSKANVEDLKAKLQKVVSYMEKSAYLHAKAGDDVTGLIVNPTFDTDAAGWLVNKGTGNTETNASQHWGADAANRYMDSYNGTKKALNFHGSQVLSNIPNGTYTVKVATRADSIGAYIFALGEAITDTLVNDSTVMKQVAASKNTKWQEIEFHADSLGGIWQAEDDKYMAGETFDETIHNARNGIGYGWTWATIDDIVVTNHEMVIGVTTDSLLTGKVFEGKWFSVDDWSLTLKAVGDNSNWTIESGIDNVAAVATKTVYYAIDGRQIALPGKGVNIVKTVYSDGRIEVKKVFVK